MTETSRKKRRGLNKDVNPFRLKIMDAIEKDRMALVVSLGANNPELAQAAEEGGADAIRLAINTGDFNTGAGTGGLKSERNSILRTINSVSKVELGIYSGTNGTLSVKDLDTLSDMGLDFYSIEASRMPLDLFYYERMKLMLGVGGLSLQEAASANGMLVDFVEYAPGLDTQCPSSLTVADLFRISMYAKAIRAPLCVSTNKACTPNDVKLLARAGVDILMLTPKVTGRIPDKVCGIVHEFRVAIGDGAA